MQSLHFSVTTKSTFTLCCLYKQKISTDYILLLGQKGTEDKQQCPTYT